MNYNTVFLFDFITNRNKTFAGNVSKRLRNCNKLPDKARDDNANCMACAKRSKLICKHSSSSGLRFCSTICSDLYFSKFTIKTKCNVFNAAGTPGAIGVYIFKYK